MAGATKESDSQELARALYRLGELEGRVKILEGLLGLDVEPLGDSEEEVTEVYLKMKKYKTNAIRPVAEAIKYLCKYFFGVTEGYLDLVRIYTADEEPYRVFLEVAEMFHQRARRKFGINPNNSVEINAANSYLSLAMKHLRTVSFNYVLTREGHRRAVSKFGSSDNNHYLRSDEPILNILAQQAERSRKQG